MAKQMGIILFTGTIGNLTFYKIEGKYYVRMKSSLKGVRVKTDPAFKLTMLYADRLALSSRIASRLYRSLPDARQQVALYRKMTSVGMQLLKAGIPAGGLMDALVMAFPGVLPARKMAKVRLPQRPHAFVTADIGLEWDGPATMPVDIPPTGMRAEKSPCLQSTG